MFGTQFHGPFLSCRRSDDVADNGCCVDCHQTQKDGETGNRSVGERLQRALQQVREFDWNAFDSSGRQKGATSQPLSGTEVFGDEN